MRIEYAIRDEAVGTVAPLRSGDLARIHAVPGDLGLDHVAVELDARDRDVHCLVAFTRGDMHQCRTGAVVRSDVAFRRPAAEPLVAG